MFIRQFQFIICNFLMEHYYDFFKIYKDNQDVYFSKNTDETMLFGDLDNALMEEYDLTVEDLGMKDMA